VPDLLPPAKPAERVFERADFAAFSAVDDFDRDEIDAMAGLGELDEDFRFDFEMSGCGVQSGPGCEVHEAKAVLGIGQVDFEEARKLSAHPAINETSQPWHAGWSCHSIPYHESCAGAFGAVQHGGDVLGIVLSIAIEGQCPFETG
jgi:hypothetical protein